MDNFINALAEKFNVDAAEIKDKASHLLDQHRDKIPDQLESRSMSSWRVMDWITLAPSCRGCLDNRAAPLPDSWVA
jgi:hypothetical protein